jgi:hypothetical protein
MAESSFPFDAGPGANTAEDGWAQMARLWAPSCVEANSLNQLNYVNSSGFVGQLDTGTAFVRGFGYKNDSSKALTHGNPPVTAGQSRNDLVVLHLDRTANSVVSTIIPGTAATTGSQVDPAITQNDVTGVWDLPIWRVVVTNGATSLGAITDLRGLYNPQLVPAWTNLTGYQAGASAGTPTPQWTKDPITGIVRMRGQILATTFFAASGVALITGLSAAIQPPNTVMFSPAISFASTNNAARLNITNGTITGYFAASQASFVMLDSVLYST